MKVVLLFAVLAILSGCKENSPEKTWYLFSYFSGIQSDSTGNGQDGLHLAYSEDALVWKELNGGRSILKPEVGADKLMRDPCILQGPDGAFHMVWTVSWEAPMIGYASSKDLVNWSEQQEISPFPDEPKARNCWAPEITYDPDKQEFMIYWSTTIPGKFPETDSSNIKGRNHRIYYTTTNDFSTYSPTKLLYDPGFNSIDASIYRDGKRWVMFIKDETRYPEVQKNIKIAFSDQLTGPYTAASEPFTQNWVEGPTALKKDNLWYLYYDAYPTDQQKDFKIGLMLSRDLQNWADVSTLLEMPEGVRHGTVFTVKQDIFENLLAHFENQK